MFNTIVRLGIFACLAVGILLPINSAFADACACGEHCTCTPVCHCQK
jgi:hypothetical protein